jgi:hypothetical protein
MPVSNSESVQLSVRIKKMHHKFLEEKARVNPKNDHRHVGTEVNFLIEADFNRAQKIKK